MLKRFPFIHNHGDFVHLDALRDWMRGTVSLEKFLASKDDKAVVQDMTFTDEQTSVHYLDLKDKVMKEEVLCKYLTSQIVDETDEGKNQKVQKIIANKNDHGEHQLGFIEKESGKNRAGFILSDVPVAYEDNTGNYQEAAKSHHMGVSKKGITIYNDNDLSKTITYEFLTEKTVTTKAFANFSPIDHGRYLDSAVIARADFNPEQLERVELTKLNNFNATIIGKTIIGGQVKYKLTNGLTLEAHKTYSFEAIPGSFVTEANDGYTLNGNLTYPKVIRCYAHTIDTSIKYIAGVISTIEQSIADGTNDTDPTTTSEAFVVSIYNPNDYPISVDQMLFVY